MHTTDSDCQNDGTDETLPEDIDPFLLKVEEEVERDDTVANSDDA